MAIFNDQRFLFNCDHDNNFKHQNAKNMVAACNTPLVAVRNGRVLRSAYDPVLSADRTGQWLKQFAASKNE